MLVVDFGAQEAQGNDGVRPSKSAAPLVPQLSPQADKQLDVKGGSGGKVPKAPAPPGARQRKLIYGRGGPQAPRFHMRHPWVSNDGTAIRIQGIRTHRAFGPRGPI